MRGALVPRLVDLNPVWVDLPSENRRGLGVFFDCMIGSHFDKKCTIRNMILFANPLDGGSPWPGESRSLILKLSPEEEQRYEIAGCGTSRWQRQGETFETLSMQPSVNAHSCGHYTLSNGVFA
jgi:hypothetical protein